MEFNKDYFEMEIVRAYNAIGFQAYCQNDLDITGWLKDGYITDQEALELRRYNRMLEREY